MSSGEAESSRGPQEGEAAARNVPWVVLSAVVRVIGEEEEQAGNLTAGADIEFELHDAPRPSIILLRERVFADLDLGDNYPYVVATNPAGGFLVHATTTSPGAADSVSVLLLCDAHARTATRLPPCDLPAFELSKSPIGSVGVAADPLRAGDYLVAQFVPTSTAGDTPLIIYSTATGAWTTADLRFSPIVPARWRPDRAFDHAGELWWVDAAYGLTAFNLFDDKPRVRFVPLPAAYQVVDDEPPRRELIERQRFFGVSQGEINFVACESVTVVYLWELYMDGWMLKNKVQFTDIWPDAGGVPHNGVAMLGFVNPHHTELYLRRGGAVFAIDMDEVQPRERKVCECEGPVDVHPHDELHNRCSLVETWDLLSDVKEEVQWPCHDKKLAALLHQMELDKLSSSKHNFKGYKLLLNGPNPLAHLRANSHQVSKAPTVDVPCSASENKSKLKGTLKSVQDKIGQETSVHKLKKLIRERRHACELMETISALDEEDQADRGDNAEK